VAELPVVSEPLAADPTLIDAIALVVVVLVAMAVAWAIGSPQFYGGRGAPAGGTVQYYDVTFRSRLTVGPRLERRLRSDRFHRTWSYVGALALAGLSVLCLVGAWRTSDIIVLILAVLLVGAAAMTARDTRAGEAHNSNAHLAGMVLAGVAIFLALTLPALLTAAWFVACIALGVVAVVALGVGRG
jgi:hypothetical protein